MSVSLSLSLENWWALIAMYLCLKVMEDSHTTSTALGEKLFYIVHTTTVLRYIGTQRDMFLFEISAWLGTLAVPVTRSTYVFPSLGDCYMYT